jgi:hypothetical protein
MSSASEQPAPNADQDDAMSKDTGDTYQGLSPEKKSAARHRLQKKSAPSEQKKQKPKKNKMYTPRKKP